MVGTVSKFDGPDVAVHCIEAEVIIKAPCIISKSGFRLKAGGDFTHVTWKVGDENFRDDKRFSVGVIALREGPCQLEPRKNFDDAVVIFIDRD